MTKPCFYCHKSAPVTFDAKVVFRDWADDNEIIATWRARFDGIKRRLAWAALDESDEGAHPKCALRWAVEEEGFGERYPTG